MAFMKNLIDNVGALVKTAMQGQQPFDITEVSTSSTTKLPLLCRDNSLTLHKDGNNFVAILYHKESSSKAFSLFRLTNETEAMTLFNTYSARLQPLYSSSKGVLKKEVLQEMCNCLQADLSWSSAHLAAKVNLIECFRHSAVIKQVNSVSEISQVAPIHVAVMGGNSDCIQELLICGADVTAVDKLGENVFHYAAKSSNASIIQMLASKSPKAINELNMCGESALHTACLNSKPDIVEQLLRWGADPNLTTSGRYPIHCAMKVSSLKCVERLCHWHRSQVHVQDERYGGSPLHWTKTEEGIYTLSDLGCNLEIPNKVGDTALITMVQKNRPKCVMALLTKGANAAAIGSLGNNALHYAVALDDVDLVKALIVFGADVNLKNKAGDNPGRLASLCKGTNRDAIAYSLNKVGSEGCSDYDLYKQESVKRYMSHSDSHRKIFDELMADAAVTAAMTRSMSASGSAIMGNSSVDGSMSAGGDRVLCLDGGGIRGLVLIQLLLALEKAVGQPIRCCFDWVGGTSTGGILALAIVHGKSIRYAQGLYFRLKNEVFTGRRPYNSEALEKFMKKEFGENTRMTDVEYPRVIVTGVLADRHPAELHLFRNYDPPIDYTTLPGSTFEPPPRPNDQFVWKAARSSGAAPTFFRSMGRFLDGGLIANNPTLDVLTEIHEYNMKLKADGKGELVRPIHLLVSLGTGRIPISPVKNCDLFIPSGIMDVVNVAVGVSAFGNLLIDQATQAEGRPVDRARAWCSMIGVPYFRLSPQLSEDLPLDATDDSTLINMMWETQCYIHENQNKIKQLALLLRA